MQSLKEYIRANQVICLALIIGQLLFAAISVYLVNSGAMNIGDTGLNEVFLILVPVITLSSISGGFYYFSSKIKLIKDKTDLNGKLAEYRSAQIVRWALLEGPSFFSIVVYLITSNYLFLSIAVTIIAIFILLFPTREKFEKDLELSWEEKKRLSE